MDWVALLYTLFQIPKSAHKLPPYLSNMLKKQQGVDRNIVIAESRSASILAPTLMSEWTSQMMLMTFSSVILAYPQMLSRCQAVVGFPGHNANIWTRYYHCGIWRFSSPHHIPELHRRPCGILCPYLWRRTERFHGMANFSWGGWDGTVEASVVSAVAGERLRWRLGRSCGNHACRNNGNHFRF